MYKARGQAAPQQPLGVRYYILNQKQIASKGLLSGDLLRYQGRPVLVLGPDQNRFDRLANAIYELYPTELLNEYYGGDVESKVSEGCDKPASRRGNELADAFCAGVLHGRATKRRIRICASAHHLSPQAPTQSGFK